MSDNRLKLRGDCCYTFLLEKENKKNLSWVSVDLSKRRRKEKSASPINKGGQRPSSELGLPLSTMLTGAPHRGPIVQKGLMDPSHMKATHARVSPQEKKDKYFSLIRQKKIEGTLVRDKPPLPGCSPFPFVSEVCVSCLRRLCKRVYGTRGVTGVKGVAALRVTKSNRSCPISLSAYLHT